jgi:hypothetical protein
MMSAPYRGLSPTDDRDSEAHELAQFARKMHAGRRVWANENFGQAIVGTLLGATQVLLFVVFASTDTKFQVASLAILAQGLVCLALAVATFVRWRRAVRTSITASSPGACGGAP